MNGEYVDWISFPALLPAGGVSTQAGVSPLTCIAMRNALFSIALADVTVPAISTYFPSPNKIHHKQAARVMLMTIMNDQHTDDQYL